MKVRCNIGRRAHSRPHHDADIDVSHMRDTCNSVETIDWIDYCNTIIFQENGWSTNCKLSRLSPKRQAFLQVMNGEHESKTIHYVYYMYTLYTESKLVYLFPV